MPHRSPRTEADDDIKILVEGVSALAVIEARNAPDATEPLSAERAARLRGHDRQLCVIAPT